MQATIKAVSSRIDEDTVLIETHLTIGEMTTTQRCGYSVFELSESRYMVGTLEERVETLRLSAQSAAESSLQAQIATLRAHMALPVAAPVVVSQEAQAVFDKIALEAEAHVLNESPQEPAVKKTRAKRVSKTPTESQE